MRTTLTLDDRLAEALKKRAFETGRSFKDVVNEALQAGLAQGGALPKGRPCRIETASLGAARPGIDLDKALVLAGTLEDGELARKMEMRK